MQSNRIHYVIGIDEAGRGPLAGPVVVGAVKIKKCRAASAIFRNIRDSKKLSARQRERWFAHLTAHPKIEWMTASVWPNTIDRINIAQATLAAVRRVYRKLARGKRPHAMLDGALSLPARIPQKTIIKGDETVPIIAAASIIAKVTRDRIMLRLHRRYPAYRFDLHKGYGTTLHRDRIRAHGVSPVHRMSFRLTSYESRSRKIIATS